MKKNGFTLIELMIAVALIVIISLFVTPKVRTLISNSKEKAYDSMVDTIEDAANSYVYKYTTTVDAAIDLNTYTDITILTLQQEGLLSTDLLNPTTKEAISTSDYVRITKTDNTYNYEYVEVSS